MSKKQDFLLPSLLDRLTDFEPKKRSDVLSANKFDAKLYKDSVLRDILFLLNTTNFQSHIDYDLANEQASLSTLNFGIDAFSGNNLSDIDWTLLEQSIVDCLKNFEPRLDSDSIKVNILLDEMNIHRLLIVQIQGILKLTPYAEEFFLKTSMDVELGTFELLESQS